MRFSILSFSIALCTAYAARSIVPTTLLVAFDQARNSSGRITVLMVGTPAA